MCQQWGSVGADSGAQSVPTVGARVGTNRGVQVGANRGAQVGANRGAHFDANRGVRVGTNRGARVSADKSCPFYTEPNKTTVWNLKCSIHNLNPNYLFGNHEKTTKILQKKMRKNF
jgi:hypothetical protein